MDVQIVRLEPARFAAVRAVSETPERDAWQRLRAWAGPLVDDPSEHPVFGFNNPNPAPGRNEYGYELWMRIASDALVVGVETRYFPGGLYAVASCRLSEIGEGWKALWEWVQASPYRWRRTHELEQVRNPRAAEGDALVDLYLPVEDPAAGGASSAT